MITGKAKLGCKAGRATIDFRAAGFGLLLCGAMTPVIPAAAQSPGAAFSNYSANSGKPIDIEAEVLEVDDKKQTATFTGNVSATQGDFNLKAKELIVVYTRKDNAGPSGKAGKPKAEKPKAEKPAAAVSPAKEQRPDAAASAPAQPFGGGADITRIDAKGKVLVTMKDGQTSTSDWAVYDVKAQTVTLGGDVKVSQGKNLIVGNRMVIDLTTGKSHFEMKDQNAVKQRLKAIFVPKKDGEAQAQTEQKPEQKKPQN